MGTDIENSDIVVDIANFSFTVGKIEEVGLAKIYNKFPFTEPTAYSVTWSEWLKDSAGDAIEAKKEEQTYKVKKIQKFPNYEEARKFFISKVNDISIVYKEESKTG